MDALESEVIHRRAARVLLFDPAGRILLLRGADPHLPDQPYWITPGGGAEGDEDLRACAVRELYEETGLRLRPAALTGPLWDEVVEFTFEGVPYRQEQQFFAARTDQLAVTPTGLTDLENRSWLGYRWWRPDELRVTDDRYYPPQLLELLRSVVSVAAGAAPASDVEAATAPVVPVEVDG